MSNDKRIIETAFPVEEVSEQGRRDKNRQQITGLHIWWASRPLGPSRATAYAALLPPPNYFTKVNKTLEPTHKQVFIAELSKWENALKPLWIEQARRDILDAHDGNPPKVLDPFGGRGAIPLEALRLGCETHSCDLNPVAVLIQKCTLEYPQKYGKRLDDDVQKWATWVIKQAEPELAPFYPKEPDGANIFAYIWARTLPCQNVQCAATIPLMGQFWLAEKKQIALYPYDADGAIAFRIVGPGYEPMPTDFKPAAGSITKATVTCPLCKYTIPAKDTRRLFQEGMAGEKMIAVVTHRPNVTGKRYRLATDADLEVFRQAQNRLSESQTSFHEKWGIDPTLDEETPSSRVLGFRIGNYHLNTYGALFNARQQLALITFTDKIRDAHSEMLAQGNCDADYARAVATCLGLWLDRIADKGSSLCPWGNSSESVVKLFGMQTMPMVWDYGEAHPLRVAANRVKTFSKSMEHLSQMDAAPAIVQQASATKLPYPDNTFDAVLTDPPYYDNIPYSYLSDLFYVWLKRSVGYLYPELFKESLTPKDEEVVAYGHREGGWEAGKRFFETELTKAFSEMHRVMKPNGIAVIVYAHKSTEGWEAMINALLDSGLVATAAWPIETERKVRWRSYNSAALTSSIYMVARKTEREEWGIYPEVLQELAVHLKEKLFTLWEWGFSGADLFIAAIGSGIEVFGKYREVLDNNDEPIRAGQMIEDIRAILERFDGEQTGAAGSHLTRFYLRWRRENGEKPIQFNDANKLAQSLGIELAEEWGAGSFIRREKTFIRVLGPQDRNVATLSDSEELIDVLHHALRLWSSGERDAMIQRLVIGRVGLNELIWNVAENISAALPMDSQERLWLEGWCADRDAIQRALAETVEEIGQGTLAHENLEGE